MQNELNQIIGNTQQGVFYADLPGAKTVINKPRSSIKTSREL